MKAIIIERSKQFMQVVSVFDVKDKSSDGQRIWAFANNLFRLNKVVDYDVLFFDDEDELNCFLIDRIQSD